MTDFLDGKRCSQCTFIACQCAVLAGLAPTDGGDCFPRTARGQTDALGHDRDASCEARARGDALACAVSAQEPAGASAVPQAPLCACGALHGFWSKVHWKPGAKAGDKPCPEGFKP